MILFTISLPEPDFKTIAQKPAAVPPLSKLTMVLFAIKMSCFTIVLVRLVWTPGRYLIARIGPFQVHRGREGLYKTDKGTNSWRGGPVFIP